MKKKFFLLVVVLGILIGICDSDEGISLDKQWRSFTIEEGACRILFPDSPNHWRHFLTVQGISRPLQYDLYVACNDESSLYMILIADFPRALSSQEEFASLEGFLRGILKSEMNAQLLCIDKNKVCGHEALDFIIKNAKHYFKGRVIATETKLYLLAVECMQSDYQEDSYLRYIDSFELFN